MYLVYPGANILLGSNLIVTKISKDDLKILGTKRQP